MRLLRAIVFYTLISAVTAVWAVTAHLLPKSWRRGFILAWNRIFIQLARVVLNMPFKVIGRENLPDHPTMIFAKHQSTWETIFLPYLLPNLTIILKKELLSMPFFGWGLRMVDPIAIDRSEGIKAFKKVIHEGKAALGKGHSLLLFPEGTRVPIKEHPEFHRTGAALASTCKVDIIPIALNSGSVWPRKGFTKNTGLITVIIGEPISTAGKSVDDINQEVYHWIKTNTMALEESTL